MNKKNEKRKIIKICSTSISPAKIFFRVSVQMRTDDNYDDGNNRLPPLPEEPFSPPFKLSISIVFPPLPSDLFTSISVQMKNILLL